MHQAPHEQPRPRFGLWLVLSIAVLVRIAVVCVLFDSLNSDPDAYRVIGETLRRTGVFSSTGAPTAFRPPLYPLLLAAIADGERVSPIAIAVLHILLGLGTVAATWYLAKSWTDSRAQFAAGLFVAVDPILLHQSTLVMTETLATFLAAISLLALVRLCARPSGVRAAAVGAFVALATLTRPTFLPWLGLCCLALPLMLRGDPKRFLQTAVFAIAATACLAPWVIRNQLVFGYWKVTTTHGGYTLLLGNNPGFYRHLREGIDDQPWAASELDAVWARRQFAADAQDPLLDFDSVVAAEQLEHRQRISRDEFEDDELAYELARRYIRAEPGMFAYSCGTRVAWLWQAFPSRISPAESNARQVARTLVGIWYLALWLLATAGLYSCRREFFASPLIWGLLLCLTFTAVHAVYWSNMRMRAPLMPFLCVVAAQGAISIYSSGWHSTAGTPRVAPPNGRRRSCD